MKHGKRLTMEEKCFLRKEGFNPKDFLRVKKMADNYVFVQRDTGKLLTLRR